MIVLDANILLYAYDSSSQMHAKAREWVEELFQAESQSVCPGKPLVRSCAS